MRILLVEDEKGVAHFIKQGLEEENYGVDLVSEGVTGLEYALSADYDLIILDVMVPRMDGLTICQRVRDQRIETPILMLTARITVEDRVKGLDAGADDYLTKPFAFDELLARIRALLRRKKNVTVEWRAGDLVLNTQRRRVFFKAQELVLRPKEYAVLEYLLRNQGRVISRTQILENIWGYDFCTGTNLVDVQIRAIRKALAELGCDCLIRTVRGSGYMLLAS